MYIKRQKGPVSVMLPDGSQMTRSDLPPVGTRRWVASRKAAVVRAVTSGLISRDEAKELYGLSDEEFEGWLAAVANHGEAALKATTIQRYRLDR